MNIQAGTCWLVELSLCHNVQLYLSDNAQMIVI